MFSPLSHGHKLTIWTFNLRTVKCDVRDGVNGWSQRREGVAEFIRSRRPALVCVQEATEQMLAFLVSSLDEYDYRASSRVPGTPDETAGFLFDNSVLELNDHATTWLGPAGVPRGDPCWDAALPRTYEEADFRLRHAPSIGFRVLNTHLDHVGVVARARSAGMLAGAVVRAKHVKPQYAQVLCGDFNSPKGGGNEVYRTLTTSAIGLDDALRRAGTRKVTPTTIHKFRGLDFSGDEGDGTVNLVDSGEPDSRHIDWMLWRDGTSLALRPLHGEVVTDPMTSGRYPSDHFAVSVTFELAFRDEPFMARL